ncbi:MAG: RbtT/DalT/CsbX family MFS transporter [Brachybacterium sp.]|nr:RbtT/DalT/CsbX family MFS transporter [Brachybacterium sp.]
MTATSSSDRVPEVGTSQEGFLDRLGIPHPLRWGFLAVLIFMTGNGVETNFVSPHIAEAFGGGDDRINLAATIITLYSLSALIGSYLAGALSDLWGPRRVMLLGFLVWVVFQAAFVLSLATDSVTLVTISYTLRGFGFPLFAFAFLVWINAVVHKERNGAAVGWFYVMFTGGMPTIGSLVAVVLIPTLGGGFTGERWTMIASTAIVLAGFLLAWFGVREPHGNKRLAPEHESSTQVVLSGLVLSVKDKKIMMGFLVRLINTAPQFGMFIILPTVIAVELGWGQSRWLVMTSVIFAGNILFNAAFGALGDRFGWIHTVRWFGIVGSALGLLAWWYVPHWVPAGSDWGFYVAVAAGTIFGIMLAGFVPLGAIMPALSPDHKGAAMAMYTTAAGGATFLGSAVVAIVRPFLGNEGVVWAFVALYGCAFAMSFFLNVPQPRLKGADLDESGETTQDARA